MFEVNWSLVGTEPESKPFLFDDWQEAFNFLRAEVAHLRYVMPEDNEAEIDAMVAKLYDRKDIVDGQDVQIVVCEISYWVLDLGKAFGNDLTVEQRYSL